MTTPAALNDPSALPPADVSGPAPNVTNSPPSPSLVQPIAGGTPAVPPRPSPTFGAPQADRGAATAAGVTLADTTTANDGTASPTAVTAPLPLSHSELLERAVREQTLRQIEAAWEAARTLALRSAVPEVKGDVDSGNGGISGLEAGE